MRAFGNHLLGLLPAPYRRELMAKMEAVPMQPMQELYVAGRQPQFAHFITDGAASVVAFMKDGESVEVSLVGREGLVEAFCLLGRCSVATRAFVQVPGNALRLQLSVLRQEFLASTPLRSVILAHVQARSFAVDQIAACNRIHQVEPRLARWLLTMMDRVDARSFAVTQEMLAGILGTRRTTVTLAAIRLQEQGAIRYSRGQMHILNRRTLERSACECYAVLRSLADTPN